MTDDALLKLMQEIDPLAVRVPPGIRKVVAAAVAAERQACIEACEKVARVLDLVGHWGMSSGAKRCATALRERGE